MRRHICKFIGRGWAILALWGVAAIALEGQALTVLYSDCSVPGCLDGRHPSPSLIQGADGNLYGGNFAGGLNQAGTIFKITPSGQFSVVYNFCSVVGCVDGVNPFGFFVLGIDGNMYGAAWWGGSANGGSLFKMTPSGQVSTVHSFCVVSGCLDGAYPWGGLIQDYTGNIYGTASAGGTNGSYGTVFQLAPSGAFTTIYSFCAVSGCKDGIYPISSLAPGAGGTFYGATQSGGGHSNGTVFKLTAGGVLTTLYSFCPQSGCADGATPTALVLATDGNLYGTTKYGGTGSGGTFFKMSLTGQMTTLYTFCSQPNCMDGGQPFSLIQATDGNFYGFTRQGQGANAGTIFKVTPSGAYTVVKTLCTTGGDCSAGKMPSTAGLFQHTNGNIYGVMGHGGNVTSNGTIVSLTTGLPPFVMTVPGSGVTGGTVQILGTNLTGATSVTFNGAAATFKVTSDTEITATVPAGAKTGAIQVVTPGGKLASNVAFTVVQ